MLLTTTTSIILFFYTHPATTEIYTLSLHDALPIYAILHRQGSPERRAAVYQHYRGPHRHGLAAVIDLEKYAIRDASPKVRSQAVAGRGRGAVQSGRRGGARMGKCVRSRQDDPGQK